MAKMRLFKFWNEAGDEKETEQISLKKAIMSVQSNFKQDQSITHAELLDYLKNQPLETIAVLPNLTQ